MLRTMRRRNAFAVTRTSTEVAAPRRPAARRGDGRCARAAWLPRDAKSRSPTIRAAAARMAATSSRSSISSVRCRSSGRVAPFILIR